MRAQTMARGLRAAVVALGGLICLWALVWEALPLPLLRGGLLAFGLGVVALVVWREALWRRQAGDLANDLCDTVDALMEGKGFPAVQTYEDSVTAKVQGKLLQYYEKMADGQRQSTEDKQTIQELVSDISHQVKTPLANLEMFLGILRQHPLSPEKREEFLALMARQMDKLEFLLASLIKMSRLETGTFALHLEESPLSETLAKAVGAVWAKGEAKGIALAIHCDDTITVCHDPKWTAEALGNILDNAVKYTPAGGQVTITVRPWQFYTRIDIADTGIGIPEGEYHQVFQRFYRSQAVADQEGVGLGLYLARGIITRQRGYISVKSKVGEGTTFSVYLLREMR